MLASPLHQTVLDKNNCRRRARDRNPQKIPALSEREVLKLHENKRSAAVSSWAVAVAVADQLNPNSNISQHANQTTTKLHHAHNLGLTQV